MSNICNVINVYDESIHDKYGFMIIAFVLCWDDPQSALEKILAEYKTDEFHACDKMKDNDSMQRLRSSIKSYINWNGSWGVMIFSNNNRHNLADELMKMIYEGCVPRSVEINKGVSFR